MVLVPLLYTCTPYTQKAPGVNYRAPNLELLATPMMPMWTIKIYANVDNKQLYSNKAKIIPFCPSVTPQCQSNECQL